MTNKGFTSLAITGSIHTPIMSHALPIKPDQIATQAIDAVAAGVPLLQLDATFLKDGRALPDPNVSVRLLQRISQATDGMLNITTGGAAAMTVTVEQRVSAGRQRSPEICSLYAGC